MSATFVCSFKFDRISRFDITRVEHPPGPRLTKLRVDPETDVQKFLIDQVKARGGWATKVVGEAGTPDVLCKLLKLPAMLIEVKRDREVPELHQEECMERWRDRGFAVSWVAGKIEVMALMKACDAL